ncbi:hypothetical protein [Paenibacillus sp. 843]|uniref:hypothetical protein n=1 Tax=Paenibacillus sp. 843 TaxID=3341795 RepID=UPI00256A5AF4|nr:hypothetical protein [Yersinia pestis]
MIEKKLPQRIIITDERSIWYNNITLIDNDYHNQVGGMALQEELIHNKGALLSLVIQDEGRAPCFLM